MIPPSHQSFEKVPTDDFVTAQIIDIVYDPEHEFTDFKTKEKKKSFGVQIELNISGMERTKKTKWMKFSYDERANLYKLFIAPLVERAEPYMAFDLDQLKGMMIKMLWKDDKDPNYQSIDTIRPAGKKIVSNLPQPPQPRGFEKTNDDDESVPF